MNAPCWHRWTSWATIIRAETGEETLLQVRECVKCGKSKLRHA